MRYNRFSKSFLILAVLAITCFLLLSGSCSRRKTFTLREKRVEEPSPSPEEISSKKAPIFFKKTSLQAVNGSLTHWALNANKVTYNDQKQQAEAELVECSFYNTDNEEVLVLSAKGAFVNLKTNSIKFRGEVEARSKKGESLLVKELRWDGKKKKLIGDRFVRITRKNSIMTARQMVARPDLKQVELFGDVNVIYPEPDNILK